MPSDNGALEGAEAKPKKAAKKDNPDTGRQNDLRAQLVDAGMDTVPSHWSENRMQSELAQLATKAGRVKDREAGREARQKQAIERDERRMSLRNQALAERKRA